MDTKIYKTLPLSLSGVMAGIMLAAADYHVDWLTALLLLASAFFLHCYSFTSKCEPENAPKISRVLPGLVGVFGMAMLFTSFGTIFLMEPLVMAVFWYMIIRAVGHTTFVSRGKGIVYILALFGLVAVYGSYYICSHSFGSWPLLFPAMSMGFMALAVKADDEKAIFRNVMILAGWGAMIAYSCLRMFDPWHFLFVLSLPLFFMKRYLTAAVFVFALLAGAGFLMYLL